MPLADSSVQKAIRKPTAVERIACPTMVVIPGAETVGSLDNYAPFHRLKDVEFRVCGGMPHKNCDSMPDRCAADLRTCLARRFSAG